MTAENLLEAISSNRTDSEDLSEYEFKAFYRIKYDNEGNMGSVQIDYLKLVQLLQYLGFRRLDIGKQSFIVRVVDNVVEEYEAKNVIDVFEEYLYSFPDNFPDGVMRDAVLSKIYQNLGTYFSTHLLNRLKPDSEIIFNEHTKDSAFFYYQNGFVEVTKDKVELKPYSELEKCVWTDQILDREFKPLAEDKYENGTFARFVQNISNYWKTRFFDEKENPEPDYERYQQFKALMGYCLHSFFEDKLRCVILTDSRMSEEASGRTGKTLVCKAMGHMLNTNKFSRTYVELNGKDFDVSDRFKYQELAIDTRLVHINDVLPNFDFLRLFNDITEGIKRQAKNESPFLVMAKMILSTNLTIRIHGDSSVDRSLEFETADYYCADNGPDKEFGEWFFRDWNKSAWNSFDNFMLSCVQIYMKNGLEKPESINLKARKLREETKPEFVQFMADEQIKHNERYCKKELYEAFKRSYSDFEKHLTQRTFTNWLRLYGQYHEDVEEYTEQRSNGLDFITFLLTEEAIARTDWAGEEDPPWFDEE